jgi:hypothetical protein
MKSTLVSAEIMASHLLVIDKLMKNLKLITLEDHQWHLRYAYYNLLGVVKVDCVECCIEFGFTTRDHSKKTMHNLFANFVPITSCLTYIFKIGVEGRESNLVSIPIISL